MQPNFGIRIKSLRYEHNMSQEELAERCELSVDQVSNIERGKSWTGEVSMALLAEAFRVPQQSLLDYGENDAFVESGGLNWRASRRAKPLTIARRTVNIVLQKTER